VSELTGLQPVPKVSINGVVIDTDAFPSPQAGAVHELLRQRAIAVGLIANSSEAEAVDAAIERVLEREVETPVSGELVAARHILFQLTPGASVNALRAKAELTLAELLKAPDRFEVVARACSNCPSAQHGGNLGQIQRGETVPEFEHALFDGTGTGIRAQLVKTRFGFHIVAVDRRVAGRQLPFEVVRDTIAERLRAGVQKHALEQYVRILAGKADVRGVDLGAASTPLVQ
jgi:peptidyl-prolyl cis-trans isomerase C